MASTAEQLLEKYDFYVDRDSLAHQKLVEQVIRAELAIVRRAIEAHRGNTRSVGGQAAEEGDNQGVFDPVYVSANSSASALSYITSDWSGTELLIPQVQRGFPQVLAVAPLVGLSLGSLPPERLKYASGLLNMMRNLRGATGSDPNAQPIPTSM